MKKRKIIAGSVLGVLLVIYVGVSIYFTNRFLPGTKLNDRKVAGYTAEKIKSEITDEIHSYVLTIKEREKKEETIAGSDIDLEPQWGSAIEDKIDAHDGVEKPAQNIAEDN